MPETTSPDGSRVLALAVALAVTTPALVGCLSGGSGGPALKQSGSSTVLPLAQAWAQEFRGADVSVAGGGSSHGRNALLTGDAHLADASSKFGPGDYEKVGCSVPEADVEAAQQGPRPWQYPSCNGVTPTEWVVAWDVLTVVVNPANDWATELDYTQLAQIFGARDTAETWSEVDGLEDAPDASIEIHAPDAASGTYEFFFEEVVGDTEDSLLNAGSDRYHGSANDNVILSKVAQNEHAIGFFGLAYYDQNRDKVNAVAVAEEGTDFVEPSFETASDYPITRPLHIYTDGIPGTDSATSQAIRDYLCFAFSERGQSLVPQVGYVKESDFEPDQFNNQRSAVCAGR